MAIWLDGWDDGKALFGHASTPFLNGPPGREAPHESDRSANAAGRLAPHENFLNLLTIARPFLAIEMQAMPPKQDLDWSAIDTVLLDMDGTLLDLHFDAHFWKAHLPRRYRELSGLTADEVAERLESRFERLQGQLDWYCLEDWSRALDLAHYGIDMVELKREVADRIRYRDGARDFLQRLGQCHIRRILVTNAHPGSMGLKFEHTDLEQQLDAIFDAHNMGAPKESLVFWRRLAQQLHFDPQRTLLIDDNLSALGAAQVFGIAHLRAVSQPDSQCDHVDTHPFAAITHWTDCCRQEDRQGNGD